MGTAKCATSLKTTGHFDGCRQIAFRSLRNRILSRGLSVAIERKRAPNLVKGNPYTTIVSSRDENNAVVDYSTTPVHVTFVHAGYRKTLKYIPGGPGNDGVLETPPGDSRVRFALTAEWTRVQDNIPPGDYVLRIRVGAVDGTSGFEAGEFDVRVINYEDDLPFSGVP